MCFFFVSIDLTIGWKIISSTYLTTLPDPICTLSHNEHGRIAHCIALPAICFVNIILLLNTAL